MSVGRSFRSAVVMLLLGHAAAPADARPSAGRETEIARCISRSSQGQKWLEATLWGLRDQEGGWVGAAVRNANGSVDLGPLQINSWWLPRLASITGGSDADVRRWLVFNTCFNIDAARWILLSSLASKGEFWSAVGAYHSPDPRRARRYAVMVARRIVARFGREIFDMPRNSRGLCPRR